MEFIDEAHSISLVISNIQAIFSGTAGIFPQAATIMVLYFGVSSVLSKELTTGMMTSFVILFF